MAYCVNHACRRQIDDAWGFCAYCGQDNRGPHHKAPVRLCSHQFPFLGSYCCRCGMADHTLPRRSRFSLWTVLSQDATDSSLGIFLIGLLRVLPLVFVLLITVPRARPSRQNAQSARSLVQQSYEAAWSRNDFSGMPLRHQWEQNHIRYGNILGFRIVRQSQHPYNNQGYTFEVQVTRSRTVTLERVEATAGRSTGRSRRYGYSAYLTSIHVERVTQKPEEP